MLGNILLIFAFVFAALAAGGLSSWRSFHLGWLAFALFLASLVFGNLTSRFRAELGTPWHYSTQNNSAKEPALVQRLRLGVYWNGGK